MSAAFETARDFAAHGLPVFPTHVVIDGHCSCGKSDCDHPGKHPRTPHGFKDATTDERQLLHWDERWPDANWVARVRRVGGRDRRRPQARRRPTRGGRHLRADRPDRLDRRQRRERGAHVYCVGSSPSGRTSAPGVEVKAVGGYVLLPGSRHPSGVAYEWANGARPWGDLPPIPEALRPAARTNGTGPAPPLGGTISAGSRNDVLASLAGTMRRRNMHERAILAALRVTNEDRCKPPLPVAEVEAIARSISRYPPEASADTDTGLDRANRLLGLLEDPIVTTQRHSEAPSAPLVAYTRSGREIRWPHQDAMQRPDPLAFPVLAMAGVPGPEKPLDKKQAQVVYKALVEVAKTEARIDTRVQVIEWADTIIGATAGGGQERADLSDDQAKYDAIGRLRDAPRISATGGVPSLVDTSTGDLYVRSRDVLELITQLRVGVSWEEAVARLAEIGWERLDLQKWQPGVPRSEGAGKARAGVFRVAQ